jgi:hypothetical protein
VILPAATPHIHGVLQLPSLVADSGAGASITVDGLVYALDATEYASGQIWTNQHATPADSSAQTAYDHMLGIDETVGTSDPTINNTGEEDAYFSFDGGDYIRLRAASAAFLQNLHKSGAKCTIELWCRIPGAGSGITPLFDTGTSDQGGADTSRGLMFADIGDSLQTTGRLRLRVKRDSSAANALQVQSDDALPTGVNMMIAVSLDGTGAQGSFFYRDGVYLQVAAANTFDGTYSSPGSSNPTTRPVLGARGDLAQRVPNGTRLMLVRVYNRNLTKDELDANWNATRARYGL